MLLALGTLAPAPVVERSPPAFAVAAVPVAEGALDGLTIDEETEIILDGKRVTLAVSTTTDDTEIVEVVIVGKRIAKLVAVTKPK